jgi:hypothetical protein
MPKCVCMGAKLKCSFGSGPKDMMVLPIGKTLTAFVKPIATEMDFVPFLNVPIMPWSPVAKKTKIGGNPAMLETSKTTCVWLGSIEVDNPGQTTIQCT